MGLPDHRHLHKALTTQNPTQMACEGRSHHSLVIPTLPAMALPEPILLLPPRPNTNDMDPLSLYLASIWTENLPVALPRFKLLKSLK
jgi:hypothetical protein